ncbi:DUF551 domain-containing protein [Serratia nevei]|uniref:DUF551 domain-containing protein n=1 Tax=Serratia nevei TaxID=2703794 RepID=UPI003FA7A05F
MTLTIEELKYGAEVGDLGIDAVRAVCAEALANREAQPVGFRYRNKDTVSWLYNDWRWPDSVEAEQCQIEWLYTAPPAPAVPDTWIACSERMPELDKRVLLYFGSYDGHIEDGCIGDDGDGPYHYFFDGDSLQQEPTHWMPLPAAPEGGN